MNSTLCVFVPLHMLSFIVKGFQCPEMNNQNTFLVIPLSLLLLSLATILSSKSSVAQRTLALLASTSLLASAYTLKFIQLSIEPGATSSVDDALSTLQSLLLTSGGGAREQGMRTARYTAPPASRRKKFLDRAEKYLPLLNSLICTVLAAVAGVAWYTTTTAAAGPGSTDALPHARAAAAGGGAAAEGYEGSTTTRTTAEAWNIYALTMPPVLVYLILAVAARYIMASSASAVAQLEGLRYEYKGA